MERRIVGSVTHVPALQRPFLGVVDMFPERRGAWRRWALVGALVLVGLALLGVGR